MNNKLYVELIQKFTLLPTETAVEIYNEYCMENHYEEFVFPKEALNEILMGAEPLDVMEMVCKGNCRYADKYLYFKNDNLYSFTYVEDDKSPIISFDFIKYVIEHEDSMGYKQFADTIEQYAVK